MGIILSTAIVSIVIWLYTSPQFGASPAEEQIELYSTTGHHDGEAFFNFERADMSMDLGRIWEIIKEFNNPVNNIPNPKAISNLKG